jgi:arginyl-tRNA synthetase
MSNAIGESIARVLEYSGAKVSRANYQGDVGPHVAKALFVLLEKNIEKPTIEEISAAYVEGARRYEENPADKLAIDALNKKIYEKTDERVNALYEAGRRLSLQHFEELYRILGTKFDFYFFESETAQKGLEIVRSRPEIFEESDGAIVFHGEKYGLHTRVFVNKLGLPTYEAKDLGLIVEKQMLSPSDEYVYITASEQSEYFKVLFEAARLVFPEIASKLVHRSHGMMRFASGKMSSRTGNVITGESLLMDLKAAAEEKMDGRELPNAGQTAQEIAVGAVKYSILKQGSGKDIIFDPEKSLSLEGDSGPYVQYALVRARALLRNAASAKIIDPQPAGPAPVERLIVHFPQVVERAARELEPHHVTTYITELAAAFNAWYASERMITDGAITSRTLAVVKAIENTLANGLQVLGIPAPEEM